MKTKIIFEGPSENYVQKITDINFITEIKKIIFLSLNEQGYLTQSQYEEAIKRMK